MSLLSAPIRSSCRVPVFQHRTQALCLGIILLGLCAALPPRQAEAAEHAPAAPKATSPAPAHSSSSVQVQCLPDAGGYLNARLSGSIDQELALSGAELECVGAIRPGGSGLRMRFRTQQATTDTKLVLVFGISGLKEGENQQALPVNLTLIREGKGEFFATQGDGKCTADRIVQSPLTAFPFKQRSWRVEVHGFCTQPARAVNGQGSVLVTRFDFAGRADFSSDESDDTPALMTTDTGSRT